jgi:alkanesulfonate monooxygenase SsuD/methylene tetrahydromethanopterin reductase-like flavin-dependent oxidoreductase (luciferase family)
MPRVAVELPVDFASAGEFLADARAYDAAGAEAIWLGPGREPLTLLAAVAVVTSRARLAASVVAGPPWPAALVADVAAALGRLSLDRLDLCVVPGQGSAEELVRALRADGGPRRVLVGAGTAEAGEAALRCAAGLGDGLLSASATVAGAAAAFERVVELRREGGAEPDSDFELWARVPAPAGRAAWRELLEAHEAIGATGVIVAHAPNLLDILRNPEEDDRQDLAIAVG